MVAEILLIRRLQIAHNRESEAFFARQPKLGGDPDPIDAEILKRLTHREANIRALFEKLMELMQVPPEESESRPGEIR